MNMRSCIAILTYRRLHALQEMMTGVEEHCPQYRCAIFEDCGQRDATAEVLRRDRKRKRRHDLMADEWQADWSNPGEARFSHATVFLGARNLGVAGNSNRAIKWFMDETDCDHLLLCNDDLHVTGDFAAVYAKAHKDLGVGLFCFCDFDQPGYKWVTQAWRGYQVKMLPRLTGIMMSFTRDVVNTIGYFDTEFQKFGNEHCDYTYRARFGGFVKLQGQDVNGLDIEHSTLKHQEVETSLTGKPRIEADRMSEVIMRRASVEYRHRHYYRPFKLIYPEFAGGFGGAGIPCRALEPSGYAIVTDLV